MQFPDLASKALGGLAADLGPDLIVSDVEYTAKGNDRRDYPERAVLLARRHWLRPDGKMRLGIGMGQSADRPNPHDGWHSPFCGIYAADEAVYMSLREAWGIEKPWERWVRWRYLDLEPPSDQTTDLLEHYATAIARQARLDWEDIAVLDQVIDDAAAQ